MKEKGKMRYEEVDAALVNAFPEFVIDEFDVGLSYCVAGSFAFYLMEAYKNNNYSLLVLAGEFIEKLYSYTNNQIDNLATVGYLEGNQNFWGNNSIDPEIMFNYLGEKSRKWWIELNRFWRGEIISIGDTYAE